MDALRADHLSVYGYHRDTDAFVKKLAADAVVFENAFTPRPKTTPSYASLFTGLYPHHHGLRALGQELAEENQTIAEILAAAGYATGGFVSSTVMIGRVCGLAQGFDLWDDRMTGREANRANFERKAEGSVSAARDWLGAAAARSFLFVHLIDPHGPYTPPSPYDKLYSSPTTTPLSVGQVPAFQRLGGSQSLERYIDAYDGEVAYALHELEGLIEVLKQRGLYQRALIIFTADHGESFGEQGSWFRHGENLDEASVRVPLIIKPPGAASGGRRWQGPVSLVDVAATVLDYAGLESDGRLDGQSLRAIIESGQGPTQRLVFAETVGREGDQWAVYDGRSWLQATACPHRSPLGACDLAAYQRGNPGARLVDVVPGHLETALSGFVDQAIAHRLPFPVLRRYRKERLAEAAGAYRDGDLEALRSLGYLD